MRMHVVRAVRPAGTLWPMVLSLLWLVGHTYMLAERAGIGDRRCTSRARMHAWCVLDSRSYDNRPVWFGFFFLKSFSEKLAVGRSWWLESECLVRLLWRRRL
jgi:hypothetical protein